MIQLSTYNITFNEENKLQEVIDKIRPSKVCVLVDENTEKLCLPLLYESLYTHFEIITIPSGEHNKKIKTCKKIWQSMIKAGMDRQSLLINLGGGVIGDMGGFCASTYMRGISFLHIPTTLLSQVDSSIGGKLGIDFHDLKNMIGVFNDPIQVMIDTRFLDTLPYKQKLSGFGEMIKHALIADEKYFEDLLSIQSFSDLDMLPLIKKSILIKKRVVEDDPFESGVRKILNFGHSIGHAIETHALSSNKYLLHGEAVAMGMVMEAHISLQKGLIGADYFESLKNHILHIYGNKSKTLPDVEVILNNMLHDKKNKNGKILMSLINGKGKCGFDIEVTHQEVIAAIENYKS